MSFTCISNICESFHHCPTTPDIVFVESDPIDHFCWTGNSSSSPCDRWPVCYSTYSRHRHCGHDDRRKEAIVIDLGRKMPRYVVDRWSCWILSQYNAIPALIVSGGITPSVCSQFSAADVGECWLTATCLRSPPSLDRQTIDGSSAPLIHIRGNRKAALPFLWWKSCFEFVMQTRHSQPPPDDEAEVESEIKEWRFPNQPASQPLWWRRRGGGGDLSHHIVWIGAYNLIAIYQ